MDKSDIKAAKYFFFFQLAFAVMSLIVGNYSATLGWLTAAITSGRIAAEGV